MELDCNVHAASFIKGEEREEYEHADQLDKPLGLTGNFYFTYDYPLSVAASFPHTLTPEMTGEDLLVLARADYERIYQEEDAAVGNPGHIPGMLNRAHSPGPYGIWGHDFSDLYFEGIEINEKAHQITFGMGS